MSKLEQLEQDLIYLTEQINNYELGLIPTEVKNNGLLNLKSMIQDIELLQIKKRVKK